MYISFFYNLEKHKNSHSIKKKNPANEPELFVIN